MGPLNWIILVTLPSCHFWPCSLLRYVKFHLRIRLVLALTQPLSSLCVGLQRSSPLLSSLSVKVRLKVCLLQVLHIKMHTRLCLLSQEALLFVPRLLVVCDCNLCAFGTTSAPSRAAPFQHSVITHRIHLVPRWIFGWLACFQFSSGWCVSDGDENTQAHTRMHMRIFVLLK